MTKALSVRVWIFLLLLTGVEVWLAYIHAPVAIMLAALLGLSLLKAGYIVAYFMHMKYERRGLSVSLFPILILCILALLMLLPDTARAQCIMCKRTAEAQNAERSRQLNRGIMVLAIPPVIIIGAILARASRR